MEYKVAFWICFTACVMGIFPVLVLQQRVRILEREIEELNNWWARQTRGLMKDYIDSIQRAQGGDKE